MTMAARMYLASVHTERKVEMLYIWQIKRGLVESIADGYQPTVFV